MKPAPMVLLSALLVAGAVSAPPASAAIADVLGTYTFEAEDGEHATWTLTPCAADTDHCVRVAEAGNPKRAPWSADANWTVGSWIMFAQQSDAILCDDGSSVPGQNTYSWDGDILSGNVSIFSNGACGKKPESISIPFKLTKTGSGPVQYPTTPVDVEPLVPAAPQDVAPSTAAAAPAPSTPAAVPPAPDALPAESTAGEVATPAVIAPGAEQLTEAEVDSPGYNAEPGHH